MANPIIDFHPCFSAIRCLTNTSPSIVERAVAEIETTAACVAGDKAASSLSTESTSDSSLLVMNLKAHCDDEVAGIVSDDRSPLELSCSVPGEFSDLGISTLPMPMLPMLSPMTHSVRK